MSAAIPERVRRLLGPAILIALALIPLWRAVLLGEAIGPVDHIRAMLDPSAPKPTTPWNVLQADSLLQFRVWRGLVFDGWRQGTIPTWNPYSLLGTPLLANSQSGALYPFHILAGALRLDLDRAIGLLAWLHLSLAGIGTFRLCRALGTDRASALFGGSAFMLSAFMLAWTPLASVPTTVAWIPWALYWIARRDLRLRAVAWLSVCLAMMLLAGHLQFAAYGLIGALVFALAQGAWRMLPAFALAACLAAAHLLPVLDFGQYSHRRTPPTAEGYAAYSKSALGLWQLGTLPAPDAYGLPQRAGPSFDNIELSTYWPSLVKLGENFSEAAIGLSPVAFVLIGAAPWRRRETRSIAAVASFGFLLAMPTALAQALYFGVPGWAATGSPGRAVVLVVLGGSVLGALGMARYRNSDPAEWPPVVRGLVPLAMTSAAILLAFVSLALSPEPTRGMASFDDALGELQRASVRVLPPALGVVGAALLLLIGRATRRGSALVAGLPVVYAFVTYAPGLVPTGPMPPLPPAPPATRIAVVNDRWSLFATPRAIIPPNLLAAARIVDTGGYDSLLDAETKRILDAANRADSPPPENGNMMLVKPTADLDALRALGVGELWAKAPIPNLPVLGTWNGVVRHRLDRGLDSGDGLAVATDPYAGRTFSTPIEIGAGGSLTVTALRGSAVTLRMRGLPGWSADGRPLRPDRWLQTTLRPDATVVRFTYDPPGLRAGLAVSGAALLALLALFGLSVRGGRRSPEGTDPAD